MKIVKVAGALLPLVLLVSCGGGTDVKPSDGESAKVADQSPGATESASASDDIDLPSEDTLEAYFNGIAHQTLDSLQEAIDAAQPGSPAAAYATYLRGFGQAAVDDGTPFEEGADMSKVDGGFKQCEGTGEDETCYEYSDIEGAGGKVAKFSVNDKPLGTRLAIGNGKAVGAKDGDSQATFIAAFEGSSGSNLFVVVSIKAGSKGVALVEANYRSVEGRQSESSDDTGPDDLDSGALANYAFVFPSAKVGGTVTLKINDSDYTESTITLKTR